MTSPGAVYDPVRGVTDDDPTYGLAFTERVMRQLGLERWAYWDDHRSRWHGPSAGRVDELCSAADFLLDLGLVNPPRPWTDRVELSAVVDTDPVFNQIRNLSDAEFRARCERYGRHFTFAEGIGLPGAPGLPDDGIEWRPTRQPVVLAAWPVTPAPRGGAFTTVMQWDSYPSLEHEGRRYGMKSESFGPFFDLPRLVSAPVELALGSDSAPRDELLAAGWLLRNPLGPTADPWTYRRYIRGSRGEVSVAKHGYVVARTGWFSERSANYLASGRPVVTQDTGFSSLLPTGEGLFAFSTLEEAAAAVETVLADEPRHGRAAREIAREWFDSGAVLTRLIESAHSAR